MTERRGPETPIELSTGGAVDGPVGEHLSRVLADHDRVLVEFYTEGCGICASMEPVLGLVARATNLTVVTCNPRDDPPLVEAYDVRSVPTLVLFADGEEVGRLADGFQGVDAIVDWAEDRLGESVRPAADSAA